tara:strand:- start:728 stop:1225 length:498 start_codon:yes stop_codon:yes gene_type:complete
METIMTKKLEDLLNLPDSKEIIDQSKEEKKESAIVEQEDTIRSIQELDKIQAALPQVKGLGDLGDGELDEVAVKSMDAYEDLMDLGMNVESRYSGRIFEVAGQMLKTNLDAKNAKLEKKLKMVELQLKKEKLDKDINPNGEIVQGEGYIVADRNSILEKLKNMDK